MEDRILFALTLAVLAMGFLAVNAEAAVYVSPEKQAALDARGWSVTDDDAQVPVVEEAAAGYKWCEARRRGTSIRYGSGEVAVRGAGRMTVCARNGNIVFYRASYKHASPSEHWDHNYGPYTNKWTLANRNAAGLKVVKGWTFQGVISQGWRQTIKLTAEVFGDHDIRWPVKMARWE